MPELLASLCAAGLTPELARTACSVVADFMEERLTDDSHFDYLHALAPVHGYVGAVVWRLREAAGGGG